MYFTERQMKILHFIRGYILDREVSPTLEEIAEQFGISKVTAHEHIGALEKKGALRKARNRARSIELADDPRRPATPPAPVLPIAGTIEAGLPIEAVPDPQTFDFGSWLGDERELYLLNVRGQSMIDEGIHEGDLVVVEKRATARSGELVVALVEGTDATLKRFYREAGRFRLQPSNSDMEPIYAQHVDIQGVVVGLLRRY